jgi:Uma2 family endonuclease
MASEPIPRISLEEYLALERRSVTRHELLDGEMFAMTGASRRHNLVAGNVFAALHAQLTGRGCEIYTHDMRVRVPAVDLVTYPDVVVACEEPRFLDEETDTLLNPTLIVEVLSPSTESYDRGNKFAHYRTLPSLAEYLLLAQGQVRAEHFVRQGDGAWMLTETTRIEDRLDLPSIGCSLELRGVYDRVL